MYASYADARCATLCYTTELELTRDAVVEA